MLSCIYLYINGYRSKDMLCSMLLMQVANFCYFHVEEQSHKISSYEKASVKNVHIIMLQHVFVWLSS